jgi:4-hydroxy-tetrahydrodipicolinate synthase
VQHTDKAVPVIVGTGGNSTSEACAKARLATRLGADGLLVVTPYYNKCTQAGLLAHYTAIASVTSLPIIVYNVPSRTGVNISLDTLRALSDIDNIVGIKEASGDMSQIARMLHCVRGTMPLYSGDDGNIVPTMSLGGCGVISVLSNAYPELVKSMMTHCQNGDYSAAARMQLDLLPLLDAVFAEVNPIGIKALMQYLGTDSGMLRLPLTEMSVGAREALIKLL